MNQPLIRLTEIAAAYDQKKVLEHINLEIAEKDFLGFTSSRFSPRRMPRFMWVSLLLEQFSFFIRERR